eukprot:scaffold267360_cov43-Tisochrysis_lutea.AAC.2
MQCESETGHEQHHAADPGDIHSCSEATHEHATNTANLQQPGAGEAISCCCEANFWEWDVSSGRRHSEPPGPRSGSDAVTMPGPSLLPKAMPATRSGPLFVL